MRQSEYLNELKENLEGKLPKDAIEDILSDYESFFASGREEGKTDDEISMGLGFPAFLAKSLLDGHEGSQSTLKDKNIANPGRRLCAYVIDAAVAVLPSFVITSALGAGALSFILLILYPAPLAGALSYMGYATFQEFTSVQIIEFNNEPQAAAPEAEVKSTRTEAVKTSAVSAAFAAFGLAFYIFYSAAASFIFKGHTIGKKLMGINVRTSGKAALTKGTILSREFLGKILINSIPFVPVISLLTILFTREHKALHDMLADTVVTDI